MIESGPLFDELSVMYEQPGLSDAPCRIYAFVMIEVQRALSVISPAYDRDVSENQVRTQWEERYQQIKPKNKGR